MVVFETIVVSNFVRVIVVAVSLAAALKIRRISKDAAWDGWNIMSISITILALNSLLVLLDNFGLSTDLIRAASSALAGILAAAAFIMAASLIGKEAKR